MVNGKIRLANVLAHGILLLQTLVVLYPLFLVLITSLKTNMEVMTRPFSLPQGINLQSYETVLNHTNYLLYYRNSFIVTGVSLLLIIAVSTLAAYALGRYDFRGNKLIYFYFLAGMMIPIRLGVINLFQIFQSLKLFDSLLALILIYTAMGIPFSVFIITAYVKQIPREMLEAAQIDGCNEWQIFSKIYLPLLRPAIATAAIYHFVPIWNDFYFPLIFIKSEHLKTVPLGTAIFFGQFQTDWPTAFAALTMAVVPSVIFYLLMSKQFIKGLTAGAVKG